MKSEYTNQDDALNRAARAIRNASWLSAFTGAGISVESGIPPFRGKNGIWNTYDPQVLDIDYFHGHADVCWVGIKEIFYDFFGKAEPNAAHLYLADLEIRGMLKVLITQNIDNLHYLAGSRNVVEYHGNSRQLVCRTCGATTGATPAILATLPPRCDCGGIYKPDFIFFGEGIPEQALARSAEAARKTDVMLIVGSTGEVFPAAMVPRQAKERGALIIEINPEPSNFTNSITDIFIPLGACEAAEQLRLRLDR